MSRYLYNIYVANARILGFAYLTIRKYCCLRTRIVVHCMFTNNNVQLKNIQINKI